MDGLTGLSIGFGVTGLTMIISSRALAWKRSLVGIIPIEEAIEIAKSLVEDDYEIVQIKGQIYPLIQLKNGESYTISTEKSVIYHRSVYKQLRFKAEGEDQSQISRVKVESSQRECPFLLKDRSGSIPIYPSAITHCKLVNQPYRILTQAEKRRLGTHASRANVNDEEEIDEEYVAKEAVLPIHTSVYIRGPIYKNKNGEIVMSDRKSDNMSISVMEKIENPGRFEGRNGTLFFVGLGFLIASVGMMFSSKFKK